MKTDTPTNHPAKYVKSIARHSAVYARKDISDWKTALKTATRADAPKFDRLQNLYSIICDDALLSSQINNRQRRTVFAPFQLAGAGDAVDEEMTQRLRELPFLPALLKTILDSEYFGGSLVELAMRDGNPAMEVIPRANVDHVNGRFYPDTAQDRYIDYRSAQEYGSWLLEFTDREIGLLNKCVPHVLFKRFAESCWSELCEIYGIPPRVIKTNTTDPEMLGRAEQMIRAFGSAAAMVIDTTEELEYATGISTNGEVYANLIRLCNNEISLLVSGAIIGQDTENGNYSKEQSSIAILDRLIDSDRMRVETAMNRIILPALDKTRMLPGAAGLAFRFTAAEDPEKLWQRVKDILPFKDVDNKWMTDTFGIPVSDKNTGTPLSADRFFD